MSRNGKKEIQDIGYWIQMQMQQKLRRHKTITKWATNVNRSTKEIPMIQDSPTNTNAAEQKLRRNTNTNKNTGTPEYDSVRLFLQSFLPPIHCSCMTLPISMIWTQSTSSYIMQSNVISFE